MSQTVEVNVPGVDQIQETVFIKGRNLVLLDDLELLGSSIAA